MFGDVSIVIDTYQFKRKVDNFLGHEFVEFFRDPGDDARLQIHQFLADIFEPYVPVDTGELVNSVDVTEDAITYDTPDGYAHYVYEGIVYGPNIPVFDDEGNIVRWVSPKGQKKYPTGRYMNYTNPLATRHWDETAISDNWSLVEQTVRDIIIEAWNNEH